MKTDSRPLVISYCATFLKPEMRHIHRQISALERWRSIVFTQKRELPLQFPFPEVRIMRRTHWRFFRRLWRKQLLGAPIQLTHREAAQTRQALLALDPRLLHIYFGHIGIHLLPLLRLIDLPAVVSFHGADAGVGLEKKAHATALAELFERVELALARSAALADDLKAAGCQAEKLRVHRTGIPLRKFNPVRRQAPEQGRWQLLQASRLIAKKGLPVTLRTFARFSRRYPHAQLVIAGEGPLRQQLEIQAAQLAVADRVHFAGFVDEAKLLALYEESDFFLHPSESTPEGDREGIPNSLLEAMATGLPALATRHGGIPEAVEECVSGYLVEEGDDETLAARLLDLAENDALRRAMGERAASAVRKNFELEEQTRKLEALYEEASGRT